MIRRQFLGFAAVGVIGFIVDSALLMLALVLGLGPWLGRALSWLAAATTTWWLNRQVTFADRADPAPFRQWLRFLAVNAGGGAVNLGVYALVVGVVDPLPGQPVATALGAAALGAVAGLGVNFLGSRRLVFTGPRP